MKFPRPYTIRELAEITGATVVSQGTLAITGLNEIHRVEPGDLTFSDHPKYIDRALQSEASAVLLNEPPGGAPAKGILVCADPFDAFNGLIRFFSGLQEPSGVRVGEGTIVHPGAQVARGAVIGKHSRIEAGVVVSAGCILGDHVVVQANTVIGSDAFYYKRRPEGYDRLLSCGRVIIGDRVEIGAACTIDRGVSGDTVIGTGTKLDNQVHIGHDTVIGRDCLLAAQVGVAGAVRLGDGVILWGQVGVQKDLVIGDGAVVLGQSGVAKSLPGHRVYFGSPVREARDKMKELAQIKRLPELLARLKPAGQPAPPES